MPFMMPCSNKGCGKQMEPYLDTGDNKVYCSACDRELTNVSHFAKVQMKSLKQFRPKKVVSFAVKCQFCSKEDRPIVSGSDIVCPGCKKPHVHLSEPFKLMLLEKLKGAIQDI